MLNFPALLPFINIQIHDLLEELIESLVAVCNYEGALIGKVMVEIVDDLYSHICFSSPWGSHYHGQARVTTCLNGLHLCVSKVYRVLLGLVARVWTRVGKCIRDCFHFICAWQVESVPND
eukprot:sb/3476152/